MSAHGRRQGGRVCVCVCVWWDGSRVGKNERKTSRIRHHCRALGERASPPRKQCKKRKLLRVCVWAWRALRRDLRRQAQSQGGGGEAEGCPDARGFWGPAHVLRPAGKRLGNGFGRLPSPRRSSQNSQNMIRSNYFSIKFRGYFEDPPSSPELLPLLPFLRIVLIASPSHRKTILQTDGQKKWTGPLTPRKRQR